MLSFESPFNRPLPFYDIRTVVAPIKGVETLKVDVADHILARYRVFFLLYLKRGTAPLNSSNAKSF